MLSDQTNLPVAPRQGVLDSKASMSAALRGAAMRALPSSESDELSSSSDDDLMPRPSQPQYRRLRRNDVASAAAAAPLPLPTQPPHGAATPTHGLSDSDSDEPDGGDEQPFYERLQPSALAPATASAAAAAAAAAPEPGSLVLPGARKQYVLAAAVAQKLYPHQVLGVKWLWSLQELGRGGILGDDMGLGKTMQSCAFLAGLLGSGHARRALVIAPKTLLPQWVKELGVCGLRACTHTFMGDSERGVALRSVVSGRGVLVTTYGMVQHNAAALAGPAHGGGGGGARDFCWDVMLLDEGHKIKNPKMKLVEQLHRLPARVRVVISGTPIQNNLMEMHALFDFTTPGLLGDARSFKQSYERPITKGLDKDASARERQTGAAIAAELRQRVEPFFLRREKKDVMPDTEGGAEGGGGGGGEGGGSGRAEGGGGDAGEQCLAGPSSSAPAAGAQPGARPAQSLPRKNDLVVWLRLTQKQSQIYRSFLQTDSVREVLNEKASPLAAITVLKKICDHPGLLSQRAAHSVIAGAHRWAKKGVPKREGRVEAHGGDEEEDLEDSSSESGGSSGDERPRPPRRGAGAGADAEELPAEWLRAGASLDQELVRAMEELGPEASCKSAFVLELLRTLQAGGHRTLIFSQSKLMLSILEAGVKAMRLSFLRLDGDVASAEERHALVQRFQRSPDIPVFLLTSQVGGLGLTLTAADRVIIVDPAWNPSVDNQSVDRAYRIGQTRGVVVYRLITCGTVEEKIYTRQVYKGGLSKTGTEEGIQFRYFSQTELRDLFKVTTEGLQASATQAQLDRMHAHQRRATPELQQHLLQIQGMRGVAGIHDHDLLFSQRPQEQAPTAQEGAAILSQMNRAGSAGVDALTNMLGSGMRLNGGSAEATKRAAAVKHAQGAVEALAERLRSMQAPATVARALGIDGGAKYKEGLRTTLREHADALAALSALQEASAAAGASSVASASSAGPRAGEAAQRTSSGSQASASTGPRPGRPAEPFASFGHAGGPGAGARVAGAAQPAGSGGHSGVSIGWPTGGDSPATAAAAAPPPPAPAAGLSAGAPARPAFPRPASGFGSGTVRAPRAPLGSGAGGGAASPPLPPAPRPLPEAQGHRQQEGGVQRPEQRQERGAEAVQEQRAAGGSGADAAAAAGRGQAGGVQPAGRDADDECASFVTAGSTEDDVVECEQEATSCIDLTAQTP